MKYNFFLAIISLFFMENVWAIPCTSNLGAVRIYLSYGNDNFSNNIGEIQESYEKTSTRIDLRTCDQKKPVYYHTTMNDSILMPYPAMGEGAYVFRSHPEIGIRLYMGVYNYEKQKLEYYLMPFNNASNYCSDKGVAQAFCKAGMEVKAAQEYKVQVFLTKRLVGGFSMPNTTVADLTATSEPDEKSDIVLGRTNMNLNIVVPENCVIEAGELIQIDFGKIKSSDFYNAGPGNMALNTNKVMSNILFDCIGISAGSGLNASIQAVNVENNDIISSNPSIGFRFSDQEGNILQPNNKNSRISSIIDQNQKVNFPFQVWPIFIGGNRPITGAVKGEAFLRIDFE